MPHYYDRLALQTELWQLVIHFGAAIIHAWLVGPFARGHVQEPFIPAVMSVA